MQPSDWRTYFRGRSQAILDDLRGFVEHESPSVDAALLAIMRDHLAARFGRAGAEVSLLENAHGPGQVLAHFPGPREERPALVLGHYDTVWERGTLARMPFRVEGARAFGPGVLDMKAGLAIGIAAIEAFRDHDRAPRRPIWFLVTCDEEVGSPSSRNVIEDLARQSAYALVVEPALAGGGLKTARKGVGKFRIEIEGKAAHAGVEPGQGTSALKELATVILALEGLAAPGRGTTLSVGLAGGGTAVNVVPANAWAVVDARVSSRAEAERIEQAIHALRPSLAGARIRVSGGFNRPPMERTPAIAALFERARALAHTLGLALTEGSTGGGSDGNFTAALGVPTLDGLGAEGAGAHAENEHVIVDSLSDRAALLTLLLEELVPP